MFYFSKFNISNNILQMILNILLFAMIVSYLFPCIIVSYNYSNEKTSISSILSNPEIKPTVFYSMFSMGFFTILYESFFGIKNDNGKMNNLLSILYMSSILIGIFGILFYDVDKSVFHYVFAFTIFVSIILFMWVNAIEFLYYIFSVQCYIFYQICIHIHKNILFNEFLFLVNFAIHFLYRHFFIFKHREIADFTDS